MNLSPLAGSLSEIRHCCCFAHTQAPRALSLSLSLYVAMSEDDPSRSIANAKKRRGVARASLTRLSSRLKDLEGEPRDTKTLELAQDLQEVGGFGF